MGLLDGFLSDTGRGGSAWLSKWKDAGKIVVWLHTKTSPVKVYAHSFIIEDEIKDDESGRKKKILRFPKFVGPDSAEVYDKQFFRNRDHGGPERAPDRDPFLILREWLRVKCEAGDLAHDDAVFEWTDHKNSAIIKWTAGELSGLVKTGKRNFNHTLAAKCEYILAVVDDAHPDKGAQIARESKLLGDKLREEIKNQIESDGDDGNPETNPYAFKWTFDGGAAVANMYGVSRFNRAKLTPEIRDALESDPPDIAKYAEVHPDDMTKIRAAFEAAAQIDLPLDQIFSEDPAVRRAIMRGDVVKSGGTAGRRAPERERAKSHDDEPAPAARTRKVERATETDDEPEPAPATRTRKRKEEPKPEPKRIPCDECGHMMLPTESKCPKCGAEYEVDGDAAPTPEPAKPAAKPTTKAAAKPADDDDEPAAKSCWSCGSTKIKKNADGDEVCANCGVDIGDDIPF
jgi:rubrerythrin